jgi:hypothetical protein
MTNINLSIKNENSYLEFFKKRTFYIFLWINERKFAVYIFDDYQKKII